MTLLELMVVLVIISILAAAAAPSFSGYRQDQRTQDAARDVSMELKRIRYRAQSLNRAMGVTLSLTNSTVSIRTSSSNQCAGLTSGTDTVTVSFIGTNPGVEFQTSADSGDWYEELICIKPSGQVVKGSTGLPFTDTQDGAGNQGGTLEFFVGRTDGIGYPYRISLPYNGIARLN